MSKYELYRQKRYSKTLHFLKKHVPKGSTILDLGTRNPFSEIMEQNNYTVYNTQGEDLDVDFKKVNQKDAEFVTAFEIFEHLFAPFNVLQEIKANKLIISVPLKLWFSDSYWGEDDWDKHYHEFEPKQLNFLLKRTGWKIIDSQKWTSSNIWKIGFRPILRHFYPRYYIVYCEKIES
ncbi:MAG: methyltransferase domain-containing protein [Flavobacteriales bacterium]